MVAVHNIYDYLDKIAPFKCQDSTDNCGLLVGDFDSKAEKILVCLDVTNEVINEAAKKRAELIIAHHPLMYRPVKKIMSNDPVYALIRNNINFIAAHTNLDIADGGITDLMLELLGFLPSDVVIGGLRTGDAEYGKIAELDSPLTAKELAEKCKSAFSCTVVKYVDGGKPIKRVGLCSGGGGDLAEKALSMGCDAYICGDLRWDRHIFAKNCGLTLIDAGHFHTEDIFCADLVKKLKNEFPGLDVKKADNSVDVCDYVL